jgi:hypothetical protein
MALTFATRRESYGKERIIRPDGSFEIWILAISRHPLLFNFRGNESKFSNYHTYIICQIVFLILLKHHTNLASLSITERELHFLGERLRWRVQEELRKGIENK